MNIEEILYKLEIVARKHTIEVCDGSKIETIPASLVNELRLNYFSAELLSNYIDNKDKEINRLNNIIKPKEVNYNYLKLLFEKKDKEEVIKSYVYKCEQLEKLYKSYEEKEIEVMKKR